MGVAQGRDYLARICGPSSAPLPHPFSLSFGSHVLNVCGPPMCQALS